MGLTFFPPIHIDVTKLTNLKPEPKEEMVYLPLKSLESVSKHLISRKKTKHFTKFFYSLVIGSLLTAAALGGVGFLVWWKKNRYYKVNKMEMVVPVVASLN